LYASSFYFSYVFIKRKAIGFWGMAAIVALMLPILFVLPTPHALEGVDIAYCNALETPFIIMYTYAFQILLTLTLLIVAFNQMNRDPRRAKEIGFFIPGIIFFLIAFSSGNIIGSITDDWELAQAGLFGMPVFIGFLAYSAVRFKTFNIKLFGAQALVVALWLLTLSLLFIRTIENIRIIVVANLVFFSILGFFLIRSVRREIEQRRQVEILAKELEKSNRQQVTLIHFITHQLKGFMSKSRNIFSMIKEGDYGVVPESMSFLVNEGLASGTKGAQTIEEILNAANIKSGKVTYAKEPVDLSELVGGLVADQKGNAEAKGLALTYTAEGEGFTITGDRMQLTNALKNMIDNAVKYTMKGSVTVTLARTGSTIRFSVADTGVGITPADMKILFTEGGHGAESRKVNVESTGFGLYIVKNIVDAHQGKVWAESEGAGKGSKFIVELPVS
jgi:signal transduction histidine kinase